MKQHKIKKLDLRGVVTTILSHPASTDSSHSNQQLPHSSRSPCADAVAECGSGVNEICKVTILCLVRNLLTDKYNCIKETCGYIITGFFLYMAFLTSQKLGKTTHKLYCIKVKN